MNYYKWNVISHYQMDEQTAFNVNRGRGILYEDEKEAAIKERDCAHAEKKAALVERDTAIQQRDAAVAERDKAIRERDNALAALRFQENTMNALWSSVVRGLKRTNHPTDQSSNDVKFARIMGENMITNAFPISVYQPEAKVTTESSKSVNNFKMCEDLKTADGPKAEWDAREISSVKLVHFDESTMPAPVCSCTGTPRQCYKWGSGGWQSSCCTTSLSLYPLPQLPSKKHSRVGGRKMSGGVFNRLLTRVAAAGHDLSIPIDLKNYWAKHGTNRFITIK